MCYYVKLSESNVLIIAGYQRKFANSEFVNGKKEVINMKDTIIRSTNIVDIMYQRNRFSHNV